MSKENTHVVPIVSTILVLFGKHTVAQMVVVLSDPQFIQIYLTCLFAYFGLTYLKFYLTIANSATHNPLVEEEAETAEGKEAEEEAEEEADEEAEEEAEEEADEEAEEEEEEEAEEEEVEEEEEEEEEEETEQKNDVSTNVETNPNA